MDLADFRVKAKGLKGCALCRVRLVAAQKICGRMPHFTDWIGDGWMGEWVKKMKAIVLCRVRLVGEPKMNTPFPPSWYRGRRGAGGLYKLCKLYKSGIRSSDTEIFYRNKKIDKRVIEK